MSEFDELIQKWLYKEFPLAVPPTKSEDVVDIVSVIMIGSKQTRYGPTPSPEITVRVRETIREAIKQNKPIPVLIAWGGRKAIIGHLLDVAEVFAINQLVRINQCIKKYYEPGVMFTIRIEDAGAYYLYQSEKWNTEAVNEYSEALKKLCESIGNDCLVPIRESSVMPVHEYSYKSHDMADLIHEYLQTGDEKDLKKLHELGWKGNIPQAQKDYYLARYAELYPTSSEGDRLIMLAEYFGGAFIRYKMGGRCEPVTSVGSYIGISFVPPIPGAPESLFSRTLYYRTIPCSWGRTHIAPWRAKGYFEIIGNELTGKITSFRDPLVASLEPATAIIKELNIHSPYIQIS
jgi:hypothetical protein